MQQTKTNENKVIVAVKKIKGTQFVGVRNYENSKGEISNQTFNVGINYMNLLKNDIETLRNFNINTLADKHSFFDLTKAYAEIFESLEKRMADEETKAQLLAANDSTIKRSKGQTDAYKHIAKGLKIYKNENTFELYVYGLIVRKTIIKKGEYKQKNSRPLTLAKEEIKRAAGLKEIKFRNFKVGNLEEINLTGITISL